MDGTTVTNGAGRIEPVGAPLASSAGRSKWLGLLAVFSVACESPVAPDEDGLVAQFGSPLVEYEDLGSWAWLPGGTEVVVAYYGASSVDLRAIHVESGNVRVLANPPESGGLIRGLQVREPYVYYAVSERQLYRVPIDGSGGPEQVFVQDPCDCSLWANWAVSSNHAWLAYQLTIHREDNWAFRAVVTNLETGTEYIIERPSSWLGQLSVAPDGSAFVDVNDRIALVAVPSGESVEVTGPQYWEISEFEFGFPWDVIVAWEGNDAVARYALGADFYEQRIGSEAELITSVADVHNGRWSSSLEHVAGWRSRCTDREDRGWIHLCLESEHRLVVHSISAENELELGRIVSRGLGPFLHPPVLAPGDQRVAFVQRDRPGPGTGAGGSGLYVVALD